MGEGKKINELGSTSRREEVHLPILLCDILLFYTCSSWFCFLLNVGSSPDAAAF